MGSAEIRKTILKENGRLKETNVSFDLSISFSNTSVHQWNTNK